MTGTSQFNLAGDNRLADQQVLQLGALENEVRGGIARIKLGHVSPGSGFSLTALHVLDSTFLTFGAVSQLTATDNASATAGLKNQKPAKTGWKEDVKNAANSTKPQPVFETLFKKLTASYDEKRTAGGANGQPIVQIGGAVAFSFTDHKTRTVITGTADLNSNDDMELTSTIVEKINISAESTGEPQKKKDGTSTGTSAPNSVCLAIIVGVENNDAQVTIEGASPGVPGAQLDALRAMRIISGVTYPFLTRPDEFVPTSVGELMDKLKTQGAGSVKNYMDGTLGLKSDMINTWARSITSADEMAVAGSITVLVFNNTAKSTVQSGVKINQDPFYRPDPRFYLKPGDPGYNPNYDPAVDNDNVTHSRNANNVDRQVVSVEATNYMQFLDVTGVFEFALGASKKVLEYEAGPDGGNGGVGGALFLEFLTNTTHAVVEPGVSLHTGSESGLNIKAEEALMGFSFSQAGANAGKVAVGGSFSYFQQHSDTLAHLAQGSNITGGRVDVYAGSLDTEINWVGGVALSKAFGAGIAVAVNNIDRTTLAVIGKMDDEHDTDPNDTLHIDVAGTVTARASVSGDIYAFTMAGAYANASPDKPEPSSTPSPTYEGDLLLPPLRPSTPAPLLTPAQQAKQNQAGAGVALAAAVAVNVVTDVTQASLSNAVVIADAIDIKANNQNQIVSATGGLAAAKTDSGATAAALAGAFSFNGIDATVNAFVRDADITTRAVDFDDMVVETTRTRFSLTADNASEVWTLAAGGAGAVAAGGSNTGSGSSNAGSLAGSASINILTGSTFARTFDSHLHLTNPDSAPSPSDVVVRATDDSDIVAVAGSLALSVAQGGQSSATALSAGVAIAVNTITTDTAALIQSSTALWDNNTTGGLVLEAEGTGSIKAFTVAGAFAAAVATQQGSGVGGAGAGAGSVNIIDADITAILESSTVDAGGAVTVAASNDAQIIAGAGAVAVAIGVAAQGTAAAVSIGASFAVNLLDGDGEGNLVWAEIENSSVAAGGPITVDADMSAGIFAVGIGAVGSVAGSGTSTAVAVGLAGSIGINTIHNNTQAIVRNSTLTTDVGSANSISVTADDDSWINSTAGAAALTLAVSLTSTSVAASLGLSLTLNHITNTTLAVVDGSSLVAGGSVTVTADSHARIDSLAFGIGLAVAVSGGGTAISVAATGALSFNDIDNRIEASIANAPTVNAHGPLSVTANDASSIQAISIAASASVAISVASTSVGLSLGLALADNRIDKDVAASIRNVPSVLTGGGDVTVTADDASSIEAITFAAAISIAAGIGTSVGVAGGASESTNIILSRTNAYIENSQLGTDTNKVGKVDLEATSTGSINAIVGAVAAAVALGNNGIGVAVGIAVARNFIGWDPNGTAVTGYIDANDVPLATLNPGQRVRIVDGALTGDIYEYIGPSLTDSDPNHPGNQPFDLRIQQYRDASLWRQINIGANAAQVQAYMADTSVRATGALTMDATATESIDAIVVAAAVGIGGGLGTGVAVSGAGVYSENKIQTDVKAYIDGDGTNAATDGITASSVTISAVDGSGINAIAGAAALAAGLGISNGVAVSIGLSLAFNEVGNDVAAFINDADEGVKTSGTGSVTVSAVTQGRYLFDLNLGGLLTAANLDDAAKADTDNPDDPALPNDNDQDRTDDTVTGNEAVKDADSDRQILEALRAAFQSQGETLALYDTVATASTYKTTDGTQDVREGTTVRVADGYNPSKGQAGSVYRYIVIAATDANNLDLGDQNYTDTSKWQLVEKLKLSTLVAGHSWTLVAPDGQTYVLEINTAGKLSVSRNTINAVSAAAAMALGIGSTAGIAISGAGAVAQNVILTNTNAYVQDSVVDSGGDVSVNATSTSTISAIVVAASVAIGGGGTAGIGASIGIAVARNFIGWTPDGSSIPAEVHAYLKDSSVYAGGNLTLAALANQHIGSIVIAGSGAVALSGAAGVAASGSGVFAENKIGVDVRASIEGDGDSGSVAISTDNGTVGVSAKSVTLTADDTSTINAFAGAFSLAFAVAGDIGASISLGVSLARNTITSSVDAYILGADGSNADEDDYGVDARTSGGITLRATEQASIDAVSAAASVAAGIGIGTAGIGISGAGADANNVILTDTHAYIQDSSVHSAGKVDIDADNLASIEAIVIGVAVSLGAGLFAGIGASIGVAIARNYIGWSPDYTETANYVTGQNPASITTGQTVKIATGAQAGNVYRYIGTHTLTRPTATGSGAGQGNAAENNNWLTRLNYSDKTQWQLANLNANAAEVQAYIQDSNVDATGALTVDALSDQAIHATVFAGAVALSGGIVGASLSGAGAASENRVATLVQAYIQGDKDNKGIAASSVHAGASDTSVIESLTGAVSVAAAFGLVGVALSIGVGIAHNEVTTNVASFIQDTVVSTTGDIDLEAHEAATIEATAAAASAAVAIGGVGLALSGAGVYAGNTILGSADAYADNSVLTSGRDVILEADNTSTIDAEIVGVSVAVGAGVLGGFGLSIGAGINENSIGTGVHAYLKDSSVAAERDLKLFATADQNVEATVEAVSVAASAGGFVAIGISGAGASATNTVTANVKAYIDGTDPGEDGVGSMGVSADSVTLDARDVSAIDATVGAISVGIGVGYVGGLAVAVGISLAHNSIASDVEAYATSATIDTTVGDLTITAIEGATITATSTAVAAAIATIAAAAGSGGVADGTITTTTRAYADAVSLNVAGSVNINATATDTATIDAQGGAGAAGLFAVAAAVTKANATLTPTVESHIGGTVVAGRDITVASTLATTSDASSKAGSVAVGLGVAVGVSQANVQLTSAVTAAASDNATLTAGNNLSITAHNGTTHTRSSANNFAGSFVGNSDPSSTTTFTGATTARLGSHATANATGGNFTLQAVTDDAGISSDAQASAGGVVAFPIANATTTTNDPATVTVGASSSITAGSDILVQSVAGVADSANTYASGGGLGTRVDATSTTSGTASATTTVQSGASLVAGGDLQILATQGLNGGATPNSSNSTSSPDTPNAEAQGSGFGVSLHAMTIVTKVYNSDVVVQPGVNLTGADLLKLAADAGTPNDTAIAYGNAHAFAGTTYADAINTVSTHARVAVAAGSPTTTMRTGQLVVTANNPGPVMTTKDFRTTAFIDFGSGSSTPTQPVNEGLIDFNANVTIAGPGALLHIGSAGQVLAQSGVTFTQSGNDINVDPITNNTNGTARLNANSSGTQNVTGTATFNFDQGMGAVTLTNDSSRRLVVGSITVLNPNQRIDLSVSPNNPTQFHATSNLTNVGGTPVTISNTGDVDVVLTGTINNSEGTTTVTNTRGSILSGGSGQLIVARDLSLSGTRNLSSIGSLANPVNVELVQSSFGPPTFSAFAGRDINLNLSARNLTSSALNLNVSQLAGRVVSVLVQDGVLQQGNTTTPQASTWNFANVSASTRLDANAGSNTPVNLSFTGSGSLPIGTVISNRGDVTLNAGGAISNARTGGGSNVTANNITLTAGTTIGPGAVFTIDFAIDSAHSSTGAVTATAGGSVTINEVAGDLSLNQVKSTGGTITLTSAGAILDGRASGGPADNVEASQLLTLSAARGIGTSARPLLTKVPTLQANAGTGALYINNISTTPLLIAGAPGVGLAGTSVNLVASGSLTVSNKVLATGDVALAAAAITVSSGVTVQSTSSDVTLTADGAVTLQSGSQVSANSGSGQVAIDSNGSAGYTIDVSGVITGQTAQITTGGGNDTINLFRLPVGVPLSVDGGGGTNNSLYIPGTAGNDTFDITGTTVTLADVETVTYQNIQTLTVDALAGNDTFNVTGARAALGTTLKGSGSDTLNISPNTGANAPVLFTGGTGPNAVFVTGRTTGDTMVAAPDGKVSGSGLPDSTTAGDVISAGLQLQYASNTTSLSITLPGPGSDLTLLGSQAPTTVQETAANVTVRVGGAPAPISLGGGLTASFTAVQNLGGATPTFNSLITVTGTGSSGDALIFDNSTRIHAVARSCLNSTQLARPSGQFFSCVAGCPSLFVGGSFGKPRGNLPLLPRWL